MLKEIVIAIQSYFEAHQFIRRHRLWKWILIPGIIYAILFVIGMYFFWHSSNNAVTWLSRAIGLERWLQQERNAWLSFLFVMVGLILRLILMFFYFSLFKYLFLIIGSPVFAYLSEKTESILEDREFPFSFAQLVKDAGRGALLALRNTLWQTVYVLSLLLLSLIPVVGWISPVIALFVECYYYGFSMLDYSFERARLSPAQSISFIGHHRGLAIGNGLIFYLMHGVILIGWILAPAYAVVAATVSLHKIKTA
ncbi:MAG: EI24 domain-containing protein [Flavisolibacter sp.]|nr:EI24 domain-containing protein [Flavisolibacter sp.]MBD0284415.1 EI24 domain-containing protein [Flavisolibacter sp.]MBD0297257.1 EI24 domain-containing protein [Flavisolibacter sp.]MBD0350055.1 EI24 domain-containing protein [Flavisolibacter sp.]MBD0365004.1 EI24 domain-containing protein [Flavisolibacter sp.]